MMLDFNEQYIFHAKELLKLITSTSQEAYIVGDCLRDLVLDREIKEVEIYTSLSQEGLYKLFAEEDIIDVFENSVRIYYAGMTFLISLASQIPFDSKIKTRVLRRHYSTSLMDFLETKIYTINTLAMGHNSRIYDCFTGRTDILSKRIRMICDNPKAVFSSKPLKMLEAIRLVSELGFRLDSSVYKSIKSKNKALLKADLTEVTKEMCGIITGKYSKKALKLLIKSKLYKRMPYFKYVLKRLYKHYRREDDKVFAATAMVKNKGYNEQVGNAFKDNKDLKLIVQIATDWPKSGYDVTTLFSHSLDNLLKANQVNFNLGRATNKQRQISKLYNRLIIKNIDELSFTRNDVLYLTNDLNDDSIEELLKDICNKVLNGKLKNNYDDIKDYVVLELEKRRKLSELNSQNVEEAYSNELFNDEDFKETEEIINEESETTLDNFEYKSSLSDFEELRRHQEELDRRVLELEMESLKKQLNEEIDKKIKQSGLLEGLMGGYRESTYNTLRKVYYDVLIKTEKYQKLENKGDKYGDD